jgi:hypothetical protein
LRRGGLGAAIALALVATLVSAINPGLLIAVPLALLLVALAPARSPYRLIGAMVLVLLFATPASGTLWYAERGWALMLGAVFLAIVTLRPGSTFLGRGITAVAVALLIGGAILVATGAWSGVEWAVGRRFREAAAAWTMLVANSSDPALANAGETLQRVAEVELMLYPALLAIASLAALAVAWWAYRRLTGPSDAVLAPMREFRFADHLVWVLIAGAVLLIAPLGGMAARAGANLTTFMAVLYVLRGAAIVVALTGVGGVGMFLLGVMTVLLLPLVASAALVIGLSDTWLDLRRRASSDGPASS